MLSQMALQEDKERRSYIQILHPPRQKYCAHTRLCSSTVWTCISNQLFLDVSQPLNVLANSTYCSQTVSLLETARLKPSLPLVSFHGDFSPFRRLSNNKLNHFHSSCSSPFSLAWSVSILWCPSQRAGLLLVPNPFCFHATQKSQGLLHQNAKSLQVLFSYTMNRQDKSLGLSLFFTPLPSAGRINRGLKSNTIWQTDIIHISELGSLKYIPVTIHTFSNVIVASSHEDKTTSDVMNNFLYLSFLGFYYN